MKKLNYVYLHERGRVGENIRLKLLRRWLSRRSGAHAQIL